MKLFNFSILVSASLIAVGGALGADTKPVLPTVTPPAGFNDEEVSPNVTPSQIQDLLPWSASSKTALEDLQHQVAVLSPVDARQTYVTGIQNVIDSSGSKTTELLMRSVLKRGMNVYAMIAKNDPSSEGLAAENRVLGLSVSMALEYYQSDIAFLQSSDKKDVTLPFAKYGAEYARFLMSMDQSLFNASAQYDVAITALKLLEWDLYRDSVLRYALAPEIVKIDTFLKNVPSEALGKASDSVKALRRVRRLYQEMGDPLDKAIAEAMDEVAQKSGASQTQSSQTNPTPPVDAKGAWTPITADGVKQFTVMNSGTIYGLGQDGCVYMTKAGGDWRKVTVGDGAFFTAFENGDFYTSATNDARVWKATLGRDIATWHAVTAGNVHGIFVTEKRVIYGVGDDGAVYTTTEGGNWTNAAPANVSRIWVSPEGVIYGGGKGDGIWRYRSIKASWERVTQAGEMGDGTFVVTPNKDLYVVMKDGRVNTGHIPEILTATITLRPVTSPGVTSVVVANGKLYGLGTDTRVYVWNPTN